MVSSNSTERDRLVVQLKVINECLGSIGVVVSAVGLDLDSVSASEAFEGVLRMKHFSDAETHLVAKVDIGGGMVDENRASMILTSGRFLSFRMRKTSRFGADVLVG